MRCSSRRTSSPLPYEYRWIDLEGLVKEVPDDVAERLVVFLDCGNIDRSPVLVGHEADLTIVNVDHHHDNTRFGSIDHVVPEASCTAEIVWDLMRALGVSRRRRSPTRSTSASSPTPAGSCTRTPGRART